MNSPLLVPVLVLVPVMVYRRDEQVNVLVQDFEVQSNTAHGTKATVITGGSSKKDLCAGWVLQVQVVQVLLLKIDTTSTSTCANTVQFEKRF